MNNFFNSVVDLIATIFSKLSVLLIIIVLGLIIFSRIDKLFKMDLISGTISASEKLIIANGSEEKPVENTGPAKIVYEGNIKPEDSAIASNVGSSEEDETEIISFEITEGQTPKEVATTLKDNGLIQDVQTFIGLLENSNLLDRIIPGVYKVPENIKNLELIESVTIPPEDNEVEEAEVISFEIKSEHTPQDVAQLLLEKGLILDPPSFIILLEENGLMDSITQGVYRLPKDIKNAELLEAITTPHSEN